MANEYFNKMNKARKEGAKSFMHNEKTYVATKTKTGIKKQTKKTLNPLLKGTTTMSSKH